jgi:hypothetical protein
MINKAHGLEVGKFYKLTDGSIVYVSFICDCSSCRERRWLEPIVLELDGWLEGGESGKDWVTEYTYNEHYIGVSEIGLDEVNAYMDDIIQKEQLKLDKTVKNYSKFWSSIMIKTGGG